MTAVSLGSCSEKILQHYECETKCFHVQEADFTSAKVVEGVEFIGNRAFKCDADEIIQYPDLYRLLMMLHAAPFISR